MTRLCLTIALATLTLNSPALGQYAATIGREQLPLHRLESESESYDIGDFVSPIQQVLHSLDHAAYELWLIFQLNANNISRDVLPLHRAVRESAAEREKLLVILRAAELLNNATIGPRGPEVLPKVFTKPIEDAIGKNHLSDTCTATPKYFRDRRNLEELRNRANYMKELHRSLLLHSKLLCAQRRERGGTDLDSFPVVSFEEEGHPADFLSMEMRETLQDIGYPINSVYGTSYHALARSSHLDLESDGSFRGAIRQKEVYEVPEDVSRHMSDSPYESNDR